MVKQWVITEVLNIQYPKLYWEKEEAMYSH